MEKGSKKNDTFVIENGEHIEINGKSGGKDTIIFNEDLGDLSISKDGLNLKIEGSDKSATILNYFSKDGKSTSSSVKYLQVGATPETTEIIDLLQSGMINSGIAEFARDKKGKISGSVFSDVISGTELADNIVAGGGNDEITGGESADTITGGTGENVIKYSKGDGNDVINLTKGENFTLSLKDVTDISKVGFEFVNKNKDLRIYADSLKKEEYITIKNFASKDVTNNSNAKKGIVDESSVELLVNGVTYDLRNAIYDIDGDSEKDYFYQIKPEKNYTGTWLNEEIDASTAPLGKKNKGVTIKGNGGDDKITGSAGNDTITGGAGKNTINFAFNTHDGYGNDVINLTKGENFTLNFTNVSDIDDLKFEFANKNKDLVIYKEKDENGKYVESVTLKNFVSKDVTNNGNAKKDIEDTSSVELVLGENDPIDLREYLFTVDNLTKNYTGSWLNEDINAEEYKKYDKKGELIKDNTQKGLSLNGKDGDDVITGSIYSDTIKGGNDNDTITGGYGNDKLYGEAGKNTFVFYNGETNSRDTIFSGKGEDVINFAYSEEEVDNFSLADLEFTQATNKKGVGTKDLKISYGDGNTVTIKDFYTIDKKGNITGINSKNSVKNITGQEGTFSLEEILFNDNIILGTKDADNITGNETKALIIPGAGNDIIHGGAGNNTYIFNKGDGSDTINYSTGTDVIKFTNVEITDITFGDYDLTNKTVTLNYGTSDSLTINGLSTDRNTVKIEDSTGTQYTVFVGDGDDNIYTRQQPNAGENAVFISSTGRDDFYGNTGINVFTNCNSLDGAVGEKNGANIYIITPEQDANIYANGQNDKIILKDLALSELKYEIGIDGDGKVKITNTINDQIIELLNFVSYRVNPTIVDKNGIETKVLDHVNVVFGDIGTTGDDILSANTKNGEVFGKGGSDVIYASGNYSTIYTYDEDLKNTAAGSSVTVKTSGNQTFTIYAQSEENIILNQGYNAHGTYYAYIDQKTSITETSDQAKSTDSVLNIMNTNNVSDKDGIHSDLSIIFNVDKGYTAASGVGNVGDVHIVDATNLSAWVNGNDFKGITIKNNVVETINSADGYSITSEQIAQLAETVANWLTSDSRNYADVNAVISGGDADDIAALTAIFTEGNYWGARS